MSTHDDEPTLSEGDLPDTAMASGSDAGSPGEHLGPGELDPDEQRLLDELTGDRTAPRTDAPEDSVLALRAAEDEGPLPADGGSQDDGLDAEFDPPGHG